MIVEVGKTYKSRIGRNVPIIASFKDAKGKPYFKGENRCSYDAEGKIDPLRNDPDDLISGPID